jgi:hypothetical protein
LEGGTALGMEHFVGSKAYLNYTKLRTVTQSKLGFLGEGTTLDLHASFVSCAHKHDRLANSAMPGNILLLKYKLEEQTRAFRTGSAPAGLSDMLVA